jgi:hypothetical protein
MCLKQGFLTSTMGLSWTVSSLKAGMPCYSLALSLVSRNSIKAEWRVHGKPHTGGSCLQSPLPRRQRSGGLTFKASWADSWWNHISKKKKNHKKKRAGEVTEDVGPEFKPHYSKKKKKTEFMGALALTCPRFQTSSRLQPSQVPVGPHLSS